jgi:hypothetical protein
VLDQIKDGTTRQLTPELVADPSLWPMFGELATTGRLLPDASLAPDHPLNVWIGLRRLMGLVWEGDLAATYEHGTQLARGVKALEIQEDETRSMTAYALYTMGRVDEALDLLESALQGEYTENLLVNASIVAARARPEVGVRYLARLVDEAPTPALQRAGLDQAIRIWQDTDVEFPQVLVPALVTVLSGPQPVSDYLRLGNVAVNVAPDIVRTLPNPGGELSGPHRLVQINGRWKTDEKMEFGELAAQLIGLYRSVGRCEWFNEDWKGRVSFLLDAVFVEFGEAAGVAMFIDEVNVNAPELFTPADRFVLLPQAGAHVSAALRARDGSWLGEQDLDKFFGKPIAEFLATRNDLDPQFAVYLADNLTLGNGIALVNVLQLRRDHVAGLYNNLNERRQWDVQNRMAIQSQMRRLLNEALTGPIAMLERAIEPLRRLGAPDRQDLVRQLASDIAEWRSEFERLLRNL